jgi:4-amino-4-deoxy-L-arabinose transferase-like glycosyltransferase
MGRSEKIVIVVILLSAVLLRFADLGILQKTSPYFKTLIMNEKYHHDWALEIAKGKPFVVIPYYRAPFYIYFLSLILLVFGKSIFIARVFSALFGVGIVFFIYLITRYSFSFRAAVIAGVIASFYPILLYYDTTLKTTSLEILLFMSGLYFFIRSLNEKKIGLWILSGFLFGFGAITRPLILSVIIVFIIIIFIRKEFRKRIVCPIGFTVAFLIPILTITSFNIFIGKDKVFIAWNGGMNFYFGNNPFSTGTVAGSPEISLEWWEGYNDAIKIAEKDTGRELKPSEVSAYWFKKGVNFITHSPGKWMKLTSKKFIILITNFEVSNNLPISNYRSYSPILKNPFPNFAFILSLCIIGFILSDSKRSGKLYLLLYLLIYSSAVIAFFVNARYRMPIIPVLIIMTGVGIDSLITYIKGRRFNSKFIITVILGIFVCVVSILNLTHQKKDNPFIVYYNLGNLLSSAKDYEKALDNYNLALSLAPDEQFKSATLISIAWIYLDKGDINKAEDLVEEAVKIFPTVSNISKLATIYMNKGEYQRAEDILLSALKSDPKNSEVNHQLRIVYYCKDDYKNSLEYLDIALENVQRPSDREHIIFVKGMNYASLNDIVNAKKMLDTLSKDSVYWNELNKAINSLKVK